MFRSMMLALGLAAASSAASAAAEMEYFVASADGTLTVDGDGRVVDVDLGHDDALGRKVLEAYEAHVRSWRFEPVLEDGEPVQAKAHLRMSLVASREKGSEMTSFGVRNVWFLDPPTRRGGEPIGASSSLRPPVYPERALRAGAGAEVMLLAELGADGAVARVATERVSMLGTAQGGLAGKMARLMSGAAEKAAGGWRIDGYAPGDRVRVPVTFNTTRAGWQRMYPFAVDPERPAWVLAALAVDDVTDMATAGARPARLRMVGDLAPIPGLDGG